MVTARPLSILVLGASYGLLLGLKLACAGHSVTLVGRDDEIRAMAIGGVAVHFPLRRSGERVTLRADVAAEAEPFRPALRTPHAAQPETADIVILALQEPQFAAPEIVALMHRIGNARRPCLSIMNLPPPPFLERLGSIPASALKGVYSSEAAWASLDPALLTLASPDPQAVRLDPSIPGELTVTLASNFKAAPFGDPRAQALLDRIARDMSHLKAPGRAADVRLPVALLATASMHVPLAKWPMLIAGNCRCILPNGVRSIAQAVADDPAATRTIYEAVVALAFELGARPDDMVDFDAYAKAAAQLVRPSSMARALAAGAIAVERIDRLVLNLLMQHHLDSAPVRSVVRQVDQFISVNRSTIRQSTCLGRSGDMQLSDT